MKSKLITILSVLAGIIFLSLLPANGLCGVTLHKQTYRVIPGKGRTQLLQTWVEYYQGNKVAVYQNNAIFITDISTNTLINILPVRRIYAVNDIDEFVKKIEKIAEQIKAQQSQGQAEENTPSQKVTVKKTGKVKNFFGYQAEQVFLYSNGKKVRELWLTDKLPLQKEINVNKALEKRFEIEDIFVALSGSRDIEATPEYKNLFKGGKVSMMTISYISGTEQIERIFKVEIKEIPEHIFKVPEGFKKVPIEQFMQH